MRCVDLKVIRMWKKMVEWEVVVILLCWELMSGCQLQLVITTPMQTLHVVYFGENEIYFDGHFKTAFVLTSTVHFDIWTLCLPVTLWFLGKLLGNLGHEVSIYVLYTYNSRASPSS